MDFHGSIFRAYRLAFIAQKLQISGSEYFRRFRCYCGLSGNEDSLSTAGFGKDFPGDFCGDVAFLAGNVAISHEVRQIHLIHRLSVVQKMERGIDMGAVVGTHGERTEVIQIPFFGGLEGEVFRLGIPGVDGAGEDFLADIIDLHGRLLWGLFCYFTL